MFCCYRFSPLIIAAVLGICAAAADLNGASGAASHHGPGGAIWRSRRVCGVNCLYALLRARGVQCDYEGLVAELTDDHRLTSLLAIRDAAVTRGLARCAIGRTTRDGLMSARKPVIAHLDLVSGSGEKLEHFVLVLSAVPAGVLYLDGTTAEIREMPWRRFENGWSGYIVHERRVSGPRWFYFMVGAVSCGLAALLFRLARPRSN